MPGAVAVPVVGVVASGVGYAVIRKVLFQMPGIGLHGIKHTFRKPLWASLTSAVGCTLCFVIYYWMVWRHRRSQAKPFKQDAGTPEGSPHAPLLQPEEEPPGAPMAPEGGSDMAPGSAPFGRTCFISPVTHRAVNERITARAGEPVVKQKVPFHDSMSKADYDKGLYGRFTRGYLLRLIAPAVTGSISIILQSWGLVYISASISLVVSSSLIVFTALLSIFFLKRDLNGLHWLGIWLAILGVACTTLEDPVSRRLEGRDSVRGLLHAAWGRLASQDPEEPSAQEYLLGILLTLASQLMAAVQMVLEESLLSGQKFRLHPLQLLGSEGTISTIFLTAIAMPIAYHVPGSDVGGCYENTLDTLAMLRQNRPHAILNTVMMLCSLVTNWTGCLVTTHLGSVFRCILMPVRTGLVWGIDLAIYYSGIGNGRLGERWRAGSILELVGFIISLIGVVLYSQANSRVAQAHNRVKRAGVSPRSADAKKICRDVFAPQHCGIPMAEADQSDNAIKANYETFPSPAYTVEEPAPMPLIQRISWRRTLQAHSSWLLDPHQVDPADHVGPTSFSGFTLVNPRLPPLRIPETVVEEDIEASADVVGAAAPAQAPAQPEVDMAGESGDTDDVDDSDEVPAF